MKTEVMVEITASDSGIRQYYQSLGANIQYRVQWSLDPEFLDSNLLLQTSMATL